MTTQLMDGLALKASYTPSKGSSVDSSTDYGCYTQVWKVLTVNAAMGENNEAAEQCRLITMFCSYIRNGCDDSWIPSKRN